MYSTQPCPVYWKVALRRPPSLGVNYVGSDKNYLPYRLALDKGQQFYFTLFDFLDSLNCKMIFIDDYNQKYPLYLYEICHDVKNQFWLVNRNSLWSMDVAKTVSKKSSLMPHDSHQKGSVLCKRWKNQFCFQLCHLAIAATNNSFTEMEEKQRVVEMNYIDHALLREFLYWLLFLRLRSRKGSKEKQGNLTLIHSQYTIVYVLF